MRMQESSNIFVFGSNLAGRHGMGAAYTALRSYGAIHGQAEGLQGRSYGIATKDLAMKTMSLPAIKRRVDEFLNFAERNPQLTFNVTAIGTGLAGYKHDDIGPMFAHAPTNCVLPFKWKQYMVEPEAYNYWSS